MNDKLKKTPLYEIHKTLGAKMIEFAGWEMPVSYEGIKTEHKYVRNNAGIFDISHMGEFIIEGRDAKNLLQKLMTNDLNLLELNKGQYSCFCYENGTVVDDCIYYMETPEKFRIIVNASNREKDFDWMNSHIGDMDVKIKNVSDDRCRLAFQGPNTDKYLNPLVDINLQELRRFYFELCKLNGNPIFIARTGYTGERGFEISFEKEYVENIWDTLLSTSAKPIGLGARDTLRLEACYSLYGHEISDQITPIEANLFWVVKNTEGNNFIGKDILLEQKEKGTDRIIVGLNLLEPGIIRENYGIYRNGKQIGYVTSGGYSPTLEKTIGLGLVIVNFKEVGTEIEISIRNKMKKGEIVETPFYRSI